MSDYSSTFGGAAKDAANSTILGADHDTEYDALATASATKSDKVASATVDNLISMDANGNLKDSTIAIGSVSSTEFSYLNGVTSAIQAQIDNLGVSNVKLNTKVINIGDWNMDATSAVVVAHGIDIGKMRSYFGLIRHDDSGNSYSLENAVGVLSGHILWDGTNMSILRATSGFFDSTSFNATSFNRGWITIQYTD
jgi:hypothetical protein